MVVVVSGTGQSTGKTVLVCATPLLLCPTEGPGNPVRGRTGEIEEGNVLFPHEKGRMMDLHPPKPPALAEQWVGPWELLLHFERGCPLVCPAPASPGAACPLPPGWPALKTTDGGQKPGNPKSFMGKSL